MKKQRCLHYVWLAVLLAAFQQLTAQTCTLGTTGLSANIKQSVSSGSASSFQPGGNIELSFDNNPSTIYHSSWSGGGFPITLNYNFSGADRIDYIVYTPRTSGDNGLFMEAELWYATTAAPASFTKIRDFNFYASSTPVTVSLTSALINPATFRVVVKSGKNNFASCAEMEFYKFNTGNAVPSLFKDNICSGLKPGTTQANINALPNGFFKNLAQCMFNNTYDTTYRVQQYEPYQNLSVLADQLKTSYYSKFENPTGIFLKPATTVIFVEDDFGEPLSLKLFYYRGNANMKQKDYPLIKGVNLVPINDTGLAYISYYTTNYKTVPPVRVHITSGEINGYFDVTKDNNTKWNSLLQNTVTQMLDIKGRRVGLLYPKPSLLQYTPNNGEELVGIYDSVIRIEHEIMGLYKYNKVPKNHMFAAAYDQPNWAWHAGGDGVNFGSAIQATCEYANIRNNMWGIAHEFGHINQIRPGLKWIGLTEVTNNVHSSWISYWFGTTPSARKRLEGETVNDAYLTPQETGTANGQGTNMVGGRFNAFLTNGILKQQKWQGQYGPDDMSSPPSADDDYSTAGDLFVRLAPLWQLQLNYQVVSVPKKDWHADIAEKVRQTNEAGMTNGTLQLNFMKNLADAVQEDLTEFFKKIGMLRTYNQLIRDYSTEQITITAQDSIDVVNYIQSKHYPKPVSPVLYYLSANSVDAFVNKAAVIGTFNTGVTAPSGTGIARQVTVDHAVWKNVAVFETYTGNTLSNISMTGGGFINNDKTRVYYPSGATAIYAVAWNGKKTLVYGTANVAPLVSRVSNIQSTQFSLVVETLTAGHTYDVSLDGGSTWALTNQTADSIVVSGLTANTSYRLLTRRKSGATNVTGDLAIVTTQVAAPQLIANGIYNIFSRGSNNVRLDVYTASSAAGTKLQVYTNHTGLAQKFEVIHTGGDVYRIIPQCATANAVGYNSSNMLVTEVNGSQSSILWKITLDAPTGHYVIRKSTDLNKCWDVYGGAVVSGTEIGLWDLGTGSDNRRWRFEPTTLSRSADPAIANQTDEDAKALVIYPNPSSGSIQVILPESAVNNPVSVVTATGQVIHVNSEKGKKTRTISIRSKGLFYLKVQSASGELVQKVMIQ